MSDTEPLSAWTPLDRYCFAPCPEQLTTGTCDCTRRIDREVADAGNTAVPVETFEREEE